MNIGIKNTTEKKYTGMFDGNAYDFMPGEIQIIPCDIAVHLATNSNQAAIGKPALKTIPLDQIPEELRKSPNSDTKTIMGVKNVSGKTVEIRYGGNFHTFPKGHVAFYEKAVGNELISRSMENGKCLLEKTDDIAKKATAPATETAKPKPETKKQKELDQK